MVNSTRENDLISIIVPVYNIEPYLEKCIASIIAQTYYNFELILVNDGSTDASGMICDKWVEKDSRIVVFHQCNAGAAAARNTGLDVARGEYIMFVDGDDTVSPILCEKLLNALKVTKSQCAVCGWADIKGNDCLGAIHVESMDVSASGREALKEQYVSGLNRFNLVVPWGKLFFWEVWEHLRFTNGLYYEDMDIMPYLYWECSKIVCIPVVGYYYLWRSGSASKGIGQDDKRFRDSLYIREKHIAFYKKKNDLELVCALAERLLDLIITSDCRDWIPINEKGKIKKTYHLHWKELRKNKQLPFRTWLRYSVYDICGKYVYQWFADTVNK